MPMRSIVGVFPSETSLNHCIVVGSPHIGAVQGLPGGVGTQVHSDVPFLRTVVMSQSTTVAESAMYSGAARSASAIFSSVVNSLLSAMVTELQHSDAIIYQSLHLFDFKPFLHSTNISVFHEFRSAQPLSRSSHLLLGLVTLVAQTRARLMTSTPVTSLPVDQSIGPIWFAMGTVPSSRSAARCRARSATTPQCSFACPGLLSAGGQSDWPVVG
jgi:hypothetical protein